MGSSGAAGQPRAPSSLLSTALAPPTTSDVTSARSTSPKTTASAVASILKNGSISARSHVAAAAEDAPPCALSATAAVGVFGLATLMCSLTARESAVSMLVCMLTVASTRTSSDALSTRVRRSICCSSSTTPSTTPHLKFCATSSSKTWHSSSPGSHMAARTSSTACRWPRSTGTKKGIESSTVASRSTIW